MDITGQNDPFDSCGHGTAVAGIIAGQKGNDFKGIAPAVNLKSFKIADESGTTNNNYIVSALDNVLEYNRQNPNAKINIINISYGLNQDNIELKNKLAEAYSSGITIISASGNDGRQGLLYPARYNFIFAAGSIDKNKQISSFSNWGEGLDFVLPGSGLKTLGINNDYVWVRGTSFSSAYLTGIAALATQAFKNKYGRLPSPQELYEVLQKISIPIKAVASAKQGYGVPDASKIVSYI
jgi:subtilisin family serine protease